MYGRMLIFFLGGGVWRKNYSKCCCFRITQTHTLSHARTHPHTHSYLCTYCCCLEGKTQRTQQPFTHSLLVQHPPSFISVPQWKFCQSLRGEKKVPRFFSYEVSKRKEKYTSLLLNRSRRVINYSNFSKDTPTRAERNISSGSRSSSSSGGLTIPTRDARNLPSLQAERILNSWWESRRLI